MVTAFALLILKRSKQEWKLCVNATLFLKTHMHMHTHARTPHPNPPVHTHVHIEYTHAHTLRIRTRVARTHTRTHAHKKYKNKKNKRKTYIWRKHTLLRSVWWRERFTLACNSRGSGGQILNYSNTQEFVEICVLILPYAVSFTAVMTHKANALLKMNIKSIRTLKNVLLLICFETTALPLKFFFSCIHPITKGSLNTSIFMQTQLYR